MMRFRILIAQYSPINRNLFHFDFTKFHCCPFELNYEAIWFVFSTTIVRTEVWTTSTDENRIVCRYALSAALAVGWAEGDAPALFWGITQGRVDGSRQFFRGCRTASLSCRAAAMFDLAQYAQ